MNYIGSKYSLMPFLIETIAAVAGTDTHMSFADLFAGTGVVGKTFKEKGYSVIANDIQYYSYILNKHLIENVPPLDVQEILDDLGVRGFTKWELTMGRGSFDGEPHYGTHAWPSMNSSMLMIVEDEKVAPLLDAFRKLDSQTKMQGSRAFVWNIEQVM